MSENPQPFFIQTNASNKGNRKMFARCSDSGAINKLLDFDENSHESAQGIGSTIRSFLKNLGLSLNNVTAFSAECQLWDPQFSIYKTEAIQQ